MLFRSAEFGLGDSTPPTTLALTDRTLADIGFTSGLSSGTVLDFRVSDIDFANNSGAFNITQVPEPGNLALLGLCMCLIPILRWRKVQKSQV